MIAIIARGFLSSLVWKRKTLVAFCLLARICRMVGTLEHRNAEPKAHPITRNVASLRPQTECPHGQFSSAPIPISWSPLVLSLRGGVSLDHSIIAPVDPALDGATGRESMPQNGISPSTPKPPPVRLEEALVVSLLPSCAFAMPYPILT